MAVSHCPSHPAADGALPVLRTQDLANLINIWWSTGKDPNARRDWGQEEKGTTEDEMAGWHHQLMDVSLSELLVIVMDREAWHAVIHGVTKSHTQLSD